MKTITIIAVLLIANSCFAQDANSTLTTGDLQRFQERLSQHDDRLEALEETVAKLIKAEPVKATLPTPAPAPTPTPKPVKQIPSLVVSATGGPHWTCPGDITTHLTGTHGANVAGLTIEQQLSLHDALHENRRVVPVQMYSAPVLQRTCPKGGCPQRTQTKRGGGGGWYFGRNMGW